MTVYHYGEEVEIVGGAIDESWALIEYDDGEVRDVPVGELKASNSEEIFDPDLYHEKMEYDVHLPLHLKQGTSAFSIRTNNGEALYELGLDELARSATDKQDVADEVKDGFYYATLAKEQPKRLLWKLQDNLLEVEA